MEGWMRKACDAEEQISGARQAESPFASPLRTMNHIACGTMDDFRIPDTPLLAHNGDPFDPYDDTSSVDITGLGLSTSLNSASLYGLRGLKPRELDVDAASTVSAGRRDDVAVDTRQGPAPAPKNASSFPKPASEKAPSRITYFSALTQRCNIQDRNTLIRPASSIAAKTTPRRLGDSAQHANYGAVPSRTHSQQWDGETPTRASEHSTSQPGNGDAGYRGIQDAIATKFQDLEKQIKAQDHEITELRFALNDANLASDALEAEKRQLKQKTDDLERKLRKSGDKTAKFQEVTQRHQEDLKNAADERRRIQDQLAKANEKVKQEEKAHSDAQTTIKQLQVRLEDTRKEQHNLMCSTAGQTRRDMDALNKKISDLTSQLQLREAELQTQREANIQLSKKMDDIPERNFQALSTCVKKVVEKLDASKSEILTSEETARHQSQDQHGSMVQYLKGLLASSQQHLEMLVSAREENNGLVQQLLGKIQTSDGERKVAESGCLSQLDSLANSLQACFEDQRASLLDAFSKKCRESDVLANMCDQQETASQNLAAQLNQQLTMSQEQTVHLQSVLHSLKKLHESPKEDPAMLAKIEVLQDQKARLESEIKDRDTQITRLEEAYKERTVSVIEGADKFVKDIQHLSNSFRQREEEYRRALDQASDLANKEAKRSLDKAREEAQKELQQERTKRQALEKDLRQTKEDFSVLEESSRRNQQSHEALQKELASAKLGNQAVTEHLEERARALEAQLGRDAALMTKLKAALADKEMDYSNLRSSMEAYDEKVHILIEHLRGWAQDYTHIGAIRSRLDMLGQIDQSCAATARIREAEQIDSVLALLRQYNARKDGRGDGYEHDTGKGCTVPFSRDSDGAHEQHISELSAFLEAEVRSGTLAGCPDTDGYAAVPPVRYGGSDSLKTPAHGTRRNSSSIRPPPVHRDRTVVMTLGPDSGLAPSSPNLVSSPVPQRPRRGKRAENHEPGSPVQAKVLRKTDRKRLATLAEREDADSPGCPEPRAKRRYMETSAYFKREDAGQTKMGGAVQDSNGVADDISTSPPSFIKIEDT